MASWSLESASVFWKSSEGAPGIGLARGQDLREMHGPDGKARAIDDALKLHQATGVNGDDRVRLGLADGIDLGAGHAARNVGELDGECPTEAAALFGRFHFAQREALHVRQQTARPGLEPQLAQGVAAIVEGDCAVEARADAFDLGHFEQESRELPYARGHLARFREALRIVFEDFFEMMRDHGRAGTGGNHDIFGVAKRVEKTARYGGRFLGVAAVERGLAAAGLILGEIDLVAEASQHVGCGKADLREDLIDDTGDKEGDARHDVPLWRIRPGSLQSICMRDRHPDSGWTSRIGLWYVD